MYTKSEEQSYSEVLADFAKNLRFEDIPSEVIAKAKTHILDSVGNALAGSTMEWTKQGSRVFQRSGGPLEATVIGQPGRISAYNAAMANGLAIAALDYDDTDYRGGGNHMSRHAVAAALAAAESAACSGKELITALVIGYEVAARVGSSLLVDRYGVRAARPSWGPEELAAHHRILREGIADMDADNPLASMQAASCIYRIALGPRAGQRVLRLRTVARRGEKTTAALCADAHGFSLHAAVRCGAHQRKELERLCPYITRPAIANERQLLRNSDVSYGSLPARHRFHRHIWM